MKKYTQKEMRMMVRTGMAQDITNASNESVAKLNLEKIGFSTGVYGMNGGVFRERDTKDLYVVIARNSLLFRLA